MSSAVWKPSERARFFDEIPSGILVVDRALEVVDHNKAFEEIFGPGRGEHCFSITRGLNKPCAECPARATFEDGKPRVVEQSGRDRDGREVHYLVQFSALAGHDGERSFVAAITTDVTATKRLQREYQTLFEKVPCFVAVINKDHRVVKANEAFRRTFGEPTGEPCYCLYKRRHAPCEECPVDRTFRDGGSHAKREMGISRDGKPKPYLVFTAPLLYDNGEVTHVIEMALDMTEHQDLENQLTRANVMRHALVESSIDAIVVLDEKERVVLANPAAEELLGLSRDELKGRRFPKRLVPDALRPVLSGRSEEAHLYELEVETATGELVPVRMAAVGLKIGQQFIGSAVIAQDQREVRRLEREKLEAERLAAVGQTVAGLAHGIKNIITGLEGGMYVTSSGMKRGDKERVREGWGMLVRNISRIGALSKNLLAFSRGEALDCQQTRLQDVVEDVIGLFRDRAAQFGITLAGEVDKDVAPAFMDPEGLHSCLANLISNAMDACLMSEKEGCTITVRLFERDGEIVIETVDTGCGMDYEVKQKAFTSFFTTKGKGGSGLGLLTTRKIVQQHGGTITFESQPEKGTTFSVRFPRRRLPKPEEPQVVTTRHEEDNRND